MTSCDEVTMGSLTFWSPDHLIRMPRRGDQDIKLAIARAIASEMVIGIMAQRYRGEVIITSYIPMAMSK